MTGRGRVPVITDETTFRREWAAGVSTRALAQRYGVSRSTITYTANRLGCPPRRPGRPPDEDRRLALLGGSWQVNERGVQVWVPDELNVS